jgi:hypothetical protein
MNCQASVKQGILWSDNALGPFCHSEHASTSAPCMTVMCGQQTIFKFSLSLANHSVLLCINHQDSTFTYLPRGTISCKNMCFFLGHFSGNLTECHMPGLFENIILTRLYRHYIFEKPILVFFFVISDKYHKIFC